MAFSRMLLTEKLIQRIMDITTAITALTANRRKNEW